MAKGSDQPVAEEASASAPRFTRERLMLIGGGILSVLVLLALGALLGRILYPASGGGSQQEAAGAEIPFGTQLSLPSDAAVRSMALSGNQLAVHYEAPDGGGIIIMNLATGRTLGRLRTGPTGGAR